MFCENIDDSHCSGIACMIISVVPGLPKDKSITLRPGFASSRISCKFSVPPATSEDTASRIGRAFPSDRKMETSISSPSDGDQDIDKCDECDARTLRRRPRRGLLQVDL